MAGIAHDSKIPQRIRQLFRKYAEACLDCVTNYDALYDTSGIKIRGLQPGAIITLGVFNEIQAAHNGNGEFSRILDMASDREILLYDLQTKPMQNCLYILTIRSTACLLGFSPSETDIELMLAGVGLGKPIYTGDSDINVPMALIEYRNQQRKVGWKHYLEQYNHALGDRKQIVTMDDILSQAETLQNNTQALAFH